MGCPRNATQCEQQTLQLAKQIRPLADEITVPVLMVASRQDLVVDFEASKRFFEAISTEKDGWRRYNRAILFRSILTWGDC